MHSHTLLIASQKGGAGKTTLTRNLAVAAAGDGKRVLMIDLDPQQSLREWWKVRQASDIQMLDRDPNPEAAFRVITNASNSFDLILVDTPPSNASWLRAAMTAASLCLIPVRPSPDDLRAVGSTLGIARAAGVPFAFLLSQVPIRARLIDESIRALAAHGRLCPANLGSRVIYAETGATGEGVVETADRRAREEIASTWAFVKDVLKENEQ